MIVIWTTARAWKKGKLKAYLEFYPKNVSRVVENAKLV